MAYSRFFLMIAASTAIMFGLMYLNTYLPGHVFWSETRVYMALLMGAAMAVVMLAFMQDMYGNTKLNLAIFAGAIALFAVSLWLVRSQATVQDRAYMRAMIPHHSIAIMTSDRAEISDPRVRRLADDIIFAQDKEIAEMRYLVAQISDRGDAEAQAGPSQAALTSAPEALASEVLSRVDPEFLEPHDIAQLFPDGPECRFSYTRDSPPVLVTGNGTALVRISGDLVRLTGGEDGYAADPLDVALRPAGSGDLHDLTIRAAPEYEAGFRGRYTCTT